MPYDLYYFPVRGKGHVIRYMLMDNKVEYNEITTVPDTWQTKFKPMMPFGQVPMLKDGEFELAQTMAIVRYISRKAGIHPTDNTEAAKADMINDQTEDIRGQYLKMIYGNYEEGKADHIKAAIEKAQYIEKLLKKWGTDFVTAKITFVDYNLFDLLDVHEVLSPGFLDNFPTLKAFYGRMADRPAIKAYRQTDTHINMPINGNGKQ